MKRLTLFIKLTAMIEYTYIGRSKRYLSKRKKKTKSYDAKSVLASSAKLKFEFYDIKTCRVDRGWFAAPSVSSG